LKLLLRNTDYMFARERIKVTLKIKGLRGRAGAVGRGATGQHLRGVREGRGQPAPSMAGASEEKNERPARKTASRRTAGRMHKRSRTEQVLLIKANSAAGGGAGSRIA